MNIPHKVSFQNRFHYSVPLDVTCTMEFRLKFESESYQRGEIWF